MSLTRQVSIFLDCKVSQYTHISSTYFIHVYLTVFPRTRY
jgi:hypothetical protein